jgi:hypothetical protein
MPDESYVQEILKAMPEGLSPVDGDWWQAIK